MTRFLDPEIRGCSFWQAAIIRTAILSAIDKKSIFPFTAASVFVSVVHYVCILCRNRILEEDVKRHFL